MEDLKGLKKKLLEWLVEALPLLFFVGVTIVTAIIAYLLIAPTTGTYGERLGGWGAVANTPVVWILIFLAILALGKERMIFASLVAAIITTGIAIVLYEVKIMLIPLALWEMLTRLL